MSRFMPADEGAARALDQKLSTTMFKSAEDFVGFYNSGLINRRHPDVAAVVDEIVQVYRNVKEHNNTIVFISREAVALDEVTQMLTLYSVALPAAEEVKRLLSEETLGQEDVFYLSEMFPGLICLPNETGELQPQNDTRLFNKRGAETLFENFSTVQEGVDHEEGIYPFRVSDLTQIDFSFLNRMANEIPR